MRTGRPSALRRLVVTGIATAALTVGAAVPAAMAAPGAEPTTVSAAPSGAAFDPEPLRRLIDPLPGHEAGALLRVDGPGRGPLWTGTAGPVSADDHVRIGSVTKVFTHTVALQLAAERRLDLDAPVRQYLPELIPAAYGAVTVRQLLDHTSGFPAPAPVPGPGDGPGWWLRGVAPADGVREAFARAERDEMWQAHRPAAGAVQQYNGVNTTVVGLLIEEVTGNSFRDELDRRILRPLQLRDTSLPAADDTSLPAPHTRVRVGGDDVTEQSPYPWAEGGMISTAADLDRFLTALFRGRLLPPAQQKLVFAVPDVPSAPGNKHCLDGTACFSPAGLMRVRLDNGVTVWGKTGSRPGWDTGFFATRDLDRRFVYSLNPTYTADSRTYLTYLLQLTGAAFARS
ncbi:MULTISPECIES: serine hydrolase domain-containing protein [Streptomyces]|uniref:Serine hydrolase domain-containing protein n=1 Tax=Streptomyces solicathayae TaxID=3081768 RepID=A0ABZ0LVT2_9ACTN|nr:serine hydrolase domain-containing protein [Streptomyces sp. HUAS YS2]WOX23618.1 serine hydrolase domain-containing protein [Streptomyces sp. HUAS YS2]